MRDQKMFKDLNKSLTLYFVFVIIKNLSYYIAKNYHKNEIFFQISAYFRAHVRPEDINRIY